MTKIYTKPEKKSIHSPMIVEQFMGELNELMKQYNISIAHEDLKGSFILEKYNEANVSRINEAMLCVELLQFIEASSYAIHPCIIDVKERECGLCVATYYFRVNMKDFNVMKNPLSIKAHMEQRRSKFVDYANQAGMVLVDRHVDIDSYERRDQLIKNINEEYGGPYHIILTDEAVEGLSSYNTYESNHDTCVVNINDVIDK